MTEINKIIQGDCFEVLKSYPDNFFDAIVTDPPYGLKFMGRKWDYQIPSVELWQEVLRVLKPGGHALVACGTRTQHRMAVNLEDAGFEIRDIISWLYGMGFPKSLNIGKAVDKKLGNERKVISVEKKSTHENGTVYQYSVGKDSGLSIYSQGDSEYEGQGTALKPAQEFFTLCRKPLLEKTIVDNVLKWGTGGLNIDDCRIGVETRINKGQPSYQGATGTFSGQGEIPTRSDKVVQGRFPANVIHDGSKEVVSQFPEQKSGGHLEHYQKSQDENGNKRSSIYGKYKAIKILRPSESGSASRFFYCAKASPSERNMGCENKHPTVKPIKLMSYLVRLITPPDGVVLDCFGGSGTTAIACIEENKNYVLIEREKEYIEIAEARINAVSKDRQLQLEVG